MNPAKVGIHYFKGDGSFASDESRELLQQSDIVVTNPPFSLFRQFVSMLDAEDKKFLVLGNLNAITYKECFNLIKEGRLGLGVSIHSGNVEFNVPSSYVIDMEGARTLPNGDVLTKNGRIDTEGNKYIRFGCIRWFTNMENIHQNKPFELTKSYKKEDYPVFDNIPEAIFVGKTADIPYDYDGIMGVPITFLDRYNAKQFKIVGNEYTLGIKGGRGYVNGKRMYSRIFIRNRDPKVKISTSESHMKKPAVSKNIWDEGKNRFRSYALSNLKEMQEEDMRFFTRHFSVGMIGQLAKEVLLDDNMPLAHGQRFANTQRELETFLEAERPQQYRRRGLSL